MKALAGQTAADTTMTFTVKAGHPVTARASLIAGVEKVLVEMLIGGSYVTVRKAAADHGLTIDDNNILIEEPGSYRLNKPITVAAVALELSDGYDT